MASLRNRTPRAVISALLAIVDVVVLAMAIGEVHGPVRLVLGLLFGLVIPGWSVVGPLRLGDVALEIGLTVAVSLAALMVTAQVVMAAHVWHLAVLEMVTAVVCLPSLVWQARTNPRTRRHWR